MNEKDKKLADKLAPKFTSKFIAELIKQIHEEMQKQVDTDMINLIYGKSKNRPKKPKSK
jgi:hypothetical protein